MGRLKRYQWIKQDKTKLYFQNPNTNIGVIGGHKNGNWKTLQWSEAPILSSRKNLATQWSTPICQFSCLFYCLCLHVFCIFKIHVQYFKSFILFGFFSSDEIVANLFTLVSVVIFFYSHWRSLLTVDLSRILFQNLEKVRQ